VRISAGVKATANNIGPTLPMIVHKAFDPMVRALAIESALAGGGANCVLAMLFYLNETRIPLARFVPSSPRNRRL